MNKNTQSRRLFWGLMFMTIIILHAFPLFSKAEEEKITKGLYSLRRAPTPKYIVTGVFLPDLVKARFKKMIKVDVGFKGRWGRSYTLFRKEENKQVKITVAVYSSVAEAEDAVLDLLNDISAVLRPRSKSGDFIGTHSWYLDSPSGSGTVVFTYDNSLFQLFSSDYNLAERSAQSIVSDLTEGVNGVTLGKKVQIPKITSVVIPKDVRRNVKASINIKASDPSRHRLSFVILASKGQLLDTDKGEEKIYIPSKSGTDELKVYTINELNVVSRVFIKKLTVTDKK